ncbi:hypothetical protein DPMN_142496 [Dreissena polymorpha]|uniref:Uncharacterized protein n=1 Tax=Dreissena polymorpha TaxID=45954 RepID=A0A9D4GFG8_DREPO|nr:hypothetical protein DPMN_142496 [Dreissena polymorpha]
MKFQSCRWKHFDFRANVKVLARRLQRTAEELAMTIPRVFSENSRAHKVGIEMQECNQLKGGNKRAIRPQGAHLKAKGTRLF